MTEVVTTDIEGTDTRVLGHDANGNTVSDASADRSIDMVINARNRLAELYKDGEQVGEYTYNALGHRVAKTSTYRGRIHSHFDQGNKKPAMASQMARAINNPMPAPITCMLLPITRR